MNVRKPILSVSNLRTHGATVHFSPAGDYLQYENLKYELKERGGLYYLPVKIKGKRQQEPAEWSGEFEELDEIFATEKSPWLLLEWCCEHDSRLASWFVANGHAAVRLGLLEWDLRRPEVVARVIDRALRAHRLGFQICIWASLPCTAWSAWQHVNLAMNDAVRDRVGAERMESLRLVRQLVSAVRILREKGVKLEIAFEWPRGALGWDIKIVKKALKMMKVDVICEFDGCQYGLKDEETGEAITKPWKVRTTMERLKEPLSRRCARDHLHRTCRGRVAVNTGRYTDEMADVVGKAITGGPNQEALIAVASSPRTTPREVCPPVVPSQEEIARHRMTHCPFASWCPQCIAAKAADQPHRQLPLDEDKEKDDVPVVE